MQVEGCIVTMCRIEGNLYGAAIGSTPLQYAKRAALYHQLNGAIEQDKCLLMLRQHSAV